MSWPTPGAVKLIDAMIRAEGGNDAFVRAVRISIPSCDNISAARVIAENTIAHALWDWCFEAPPPLDTHSMGAFVTFLGGRWAPVGAANDPGNLNRNWVPNVLASIRQQGGVA